MLAGMAAAAAAPPGDFQAARPAYWFPLLLPAAVLLLSGLGALVSGLRDRPR